MNAECLVRKCRAVGIDPPLELAIAARMQRRFREAIQRAKVIKPPKLPKPRKKMGRPITSTHPRSAYWREFKRKRKEREAER